MQVASVCLRCRGVLVFALFSPRRLRLGYRAVRQRCESDNGFKRACVSALVAGVLLAVLNPPLGLFALWFALVHTMPRSILERRVENRRET